MLTPRERIVGHAEKIIAELATLDEFEQARLLAFVEGLKLARRNALTAQQRDDCAELAALLAPFRIPLAGYRFDREEASSR